MAMQKRKLDFSMMKRVIGEIFHANPILAPIVTVLIIFNAIAGTMPAIFMERAVTIITKYYAARDWAGAKEEIIPLVLLLVVIYVLALICSFFYNRLLAPLTQNTLDSIRRRVFDNMQNLPIRYFDTTKHGDIMSTYTNDVDALRQLISQSLPQLLTASLTIICVFCIMVFYSLWMTLLVLCGVVIMLIVTKKVGGGSAKYFVLQQKDVGVLEGFIQEMMNGQKVIKVFTHEDASKEDFDKLNNTLCQDSTRANQYANILMPVLFNIGNTLYVCVAIFGGILLSIRAFNPSISALVGMQESIVSISVIVAFLNMTKQFTGNISGVSNQINAVVMALAGAGRVYDLMDKEKEVDDGYVTLVNAKEENGELIETDTHTGIWAWKHPHEDGTITYTRLRGEVKMQEVDFGYEENKIVLHDITLYAEPGQKVAFVGATGAGKTTITNLINRFYDIADGKIRYDGININKIAKSSLRRSLGIVLQETNLFTGSVMDNIRYGKLDATDEECIAAAKLVSADDFISRLPDGYQTMLTANGANLSQGQRQLIAIARAAVADPPVMILDEATSSIDTRTEEIVQKGMDALMQGRTVFVIAHRLSTVKNSNVIMVLDHGRIIERGTHDSLIEQKGRYFQLYTGAFELE